MCAIAGYVNGNNSSEEILVKMTNAMAHRGPDDSGIYLHGEHVGLGHRRLSVIDVSNGGHQPMHFHNLSIVFNGEIYNYKEIKIALEEKGYTFESNSDTAVILRAFHCWGIQAVHKFVGMFSFAIIDTLKNKLYLVRDRAGVKPLYYYKQNNTFLFASELKAFHEHPDFQKQIDMDALAQYFLYGYILSPSTIFKNTYKLKPGHFIELNLVTSDFDLKKYWDITDSYLKPKLKIDENEAIDETEELLKSACQYRMVADVPVGVFLSGGYDSATVTGILQTNQTARLKTFTIGFESPAYNEAGYAKEVAEYLNTDHTEVYCSEEQAKDIVTELPFFFDEPFFDSSAIPTILVSRIAREQVTVSLSADGGDELFGGYDKYNSIMRVYNRLKKLPLMFHKPIGDLISLYPPRYVPFNKSFRFDHFYHTVGDLLKHGSSPEQILRHLSHRINERDLKLLFKRKVTERRDSAFYDKYDHLNDPLSTMLNVDYKTYMVDDVLVKVDRATMSVSLEGREPLLDHRLVEFVAQLPSDLKIKNGNKKYLLKKIAHRYVPEKILDRPKMGFAIPVVNWFRNDLKEILEFYLNEDRIRKQELFNVEFIQRLKQRYYNGLNDDFEFIWSMLIFQMWYERWMK